MAVGSHPRGLPAARAIVPSALTPSALLGHSGARRAPRTKVGAFVALTKPRIIELLLVSTVPTMILADEGFPSIGLILATLVGGTLAAGGANAINMYLDRDIDRLMPRTQHRPLVTGAVTPRAALVFAVLLEVVAFAELWALVNLLAAVLALAATLFYVFVYTIWLKRTSTKNIVIGGAAGGGSRLGGGGGGPGGLGGPPVGVFSRVFFWAPPPLLAPALRHAPAVRA